MKTVPKKHTHFSLPIEVRFQAIPTTWAAGENSDGQRVLFPAVSQSKKRRLAPVEEPEEIRKRFFKMGDDEKSALEFLNSVGVWYAVNDMRGGLEEVSDPRILAMRFQGTFGSTYFNGRAMVVTPEYLAGERDYWRGLLLDRSLSKLRAAFDPKSPDMHAMFATMCNTLQVHMEWRDGHPHAVIQPITGTELLTALAWIDLVWKREGKTCKKCGNPYTKGGSRFCDALCERAHTKRISRHRSKLADAIVQANRGLSTRALLTKLEEAGIKRTRDWVVKARGAK